MSNNNSNSSKRPKKFMTTPPPGAVSPVGLRFSSNSNYNNVSTVPGNGNSNRGELNALSEYSGERSEEEFEIPPTEAPPGTPFTENNGNYNGNNENYNGNNNSNNSNQRNKNTKLPAYITQNRTSNNNQLPRITANNLEAYPTLGGRIFSRNTNPKKPGKRNNGKTRKNRKARKVKNTRKNRK